MKYSPDRIKAIADMLRAGHGRVKATEAAGISYQTFLNWIETKVEFSESVKKAEAEGHQTIKETCLDIILKAATDNKRPVWQAAAWILERRFPGEYRQRQNIDTIQEVAMKVDPFAQIRKNAGIEDIESKTEPVVKKSENSYGHVSGHVTGHKSHFAHT